MKRQSLSKKMIRTIIGLSIVLIIGLGTAVGRFYWKETMNTYKKQGLSYAKMASEYIDGDKILSYLETEKKDAYYHQIENFLNVSQKQTDMKYYYVFVPFENDLVYIWDANALKPDETEVDACELGYREGYMDGGKDIAFSVFKHNPPEEIDLFNDIEISLVIKYVVNKQISEIKITNGTNIDAILSAIFCIFGFVDWICSTLLIKEDR